MFREIQSYLYVGVQNVTNCLQQVELYHFSYVKFKLCLIKSF
jgi:hypothetical protein